MNSAVKQVTDILSACGCKPVATVDKNGETIIKINAPEPTKETPKKKK